MTRKILHNDWAPLLQEEFEKDYYKSLRKFLVEQYNSEIVYPPMEDIFNALHYTPFERVKAVILGQDPYHSPNQAHGLSFSVQPGINPPPSLVNIFKELEADLGYARPNHGNLKSWATEGVLLLNNVLTVRQGEAHSHRGKGWEKFTDKIIETLNDKEHPVVYLLWGRAAQAKEAIIDTDKHYIIKAPHPSPFSAHTGFFGSKPFSRTNEVLRSLQLREINWKINELEP